MPLMQVEDGFATPGSFSFTGNSVATIQELPSNGSWPANLVQNTLIQCQQPVNFGFTWAVSGALVPLLSPLTWKIQLFFEKWGATEYNFNLPITPITYVPVSGHVYNTVVQVPANFIPEGIYDIVAVLRLYHNGTPPTNLLPLPVAGFAEFGKIEFYNA